MRKVLVVAVVSILLWISIVEGSSLALRDPRIEIGKPRAGYLYIFGKEIQPILLRKAVVIGGCNFAIWGWNISRIEYYIDGELVPKETFYVHNGIRFYRVVAYDPTGHTASDEVAAIGMFILPSFNLTAR